MIVHVLVVTAESHRRHRLEGVLRRLEQIRLTTVTPGRLWDRLKRGDVDVLLVDASCLGAQPVEVVSAVRKLPEQPEVVALAAAEDPAMRGRLLAAGCLAVLNVGLEDAILLETIRTLLQRRRRDQSCQIGDRQRLRSSLQDFESSSPTMRQFMELAQRVVHSDSSLLLLGETGVGKERLASAIHHEGPRRNGPFLCVNCAALPEALLESELFGHEIGAFTGATRTRRGYFEMAHGGTLFLDEIAELPLHLQVKLLRVLEDRNVQRVGGETPMRMDVRLMAATNRDLEAETEAGRFRADLFYRLAVVMLHVPPLRERREDIPGLVASYLNHFAVALNRPVPGLTPSALDALERYDWPGNVRELINIVERSTLLARGPEIDLPDLPSAVGAAAAGRSGSSGLPRNRVAAVADRDWKGVTLAAARDGVLEDFHRAYLDRLLSEHAGRVGRAARTAGVSVRTLYELMRRYHLRKEDYRHLPGEDRLEKSEVQG